MVPNKKNFLTELQTSDDRVKRRWMIGLTTLASIFVVAVWFVYFNAIVFRPVDSTPETPAESSDNLTFFSTLRRGTALVGDKLINLIRKAGGTATYNIKPTP